MERFLQKRPFTGSESRLLVHQSGKAVEAVWVRSKLKEACRKIGLEGDYNTHSLRIGAASDAAKNGLPEHLIKLRGRWKSDAYLRYLRPSGKQLGETVAKMTSTNTEGRNRMNIGGTRSDKRKRGEGIKEGGL